MSDVERLSKDGKYLVHFLAIYMLAHFREARAYDYVVRIASLPDELKEDESYSMISKSDVYSLQGWDGVDFEEDFDDDEIPLNIPFKRESFVGRNDPCPCGSGKKYKKCCEI